MSLVCSETKSVTGLPSGPRILKAKPALATESPVGAKV